MSHLTLSTGSKLRRASFAVAAAGVLAAILVVGNPAPSRASATVVPITFPLEKRVKFSDTYGAPRTGHTHQGNDLMTPKMTKEMACVSGVVTLTYNSSWGNGIWLAGDDGHGYKYLHINNDTPGTDDGKGGWANAFAPGLQSGMRVKQGQFIAYAGDSGNAEGTGPHLHFEIHATTSNSSASMDPYDSLMAAPLYNGTQPPVPPPSSGTRYESTHAYIAYAGNWLTLNTSGASNGSYKYANSAAKVIVSFNGTNLDLIATKGTTMGKGEVYLDGVDKGTIDFSNATVLRQKKVWSTGKVAAGKHTVELRWLGKAGVLGGTRVNIDAVDITGTLVNASPSTTVEQTAGGFHYAGVWTKEITPNASGGSFAWINKSGGSVTINFTGTSLAWIAKKSPVYGKAKIKLDNKAAVSVDLYSATTKWCQVVWNSGTLTNGVHKVVITWTGTKNASATNTNIGIDAVRVVGKIN